MQLYSYMKRVYTDVRTVFVSKLSEYIHLDFFRPSAACGVAFPWKELLEQWPLQFAYTPHFKLLLKLF